MNRDVLRHLRCPVCAGPLAAAGPAALRCGAGHSFDISRQGYASLLAAPAAHPGDTAQMVAARARFLDAGHYRFISTALADAAVAEVARCGAARPGPARPGGRPAAARPGAAPAEVDRTGGDRPGLVIDAGCGTGQHLAAVLDALPDAVGLGLDVAKPALRRAARAHPRATAAAADTWRRLPVADHAAALVLDVFAPRHGAEFHRVLRTDGALLVVTPTAGHLAELVGPLGLLTVDPAKSDRLAASLSDWFTPAGERRLERALRLGHEEVGTLVGMGPSAWHADPAGLAGRIAALPEPVTVTASVRLSRHHPRPAG